MHPPSEGGRYSSGNAFKDMQDRIARLEQALEKLTTGSSPGSTCGGISVGEGRGSNGDSVTPMAAVPKTWTESSGFVERDPSFERQSYLASQIVELASPASAGSAEVADQLKTLSAMSNVPVTSKPRRLTKGTGPDHILKRDQAPASFVLKVIRFLESCLSTLESPPLHDCR